jgi:sodium-independent sulfate anion transporter 11
VLKRLGITVGAVVVPQSMAYAKLAQLPVEFGLYSSFMGVLIYWFFATSKDITIGPVAVLSTVTGNVILRVEGKVPGVSRDIIASSLAIVSGAIVLFLGLIRLGWIVDLISLPAISAFMTGSAISIAAGQVPAMMGITGFSTRDATYKVIINTLKHLGKTDINASFGLTALFLLYLIRFTCNQLAKRYPSRAKTFFFLNTLRTAFVILLYVLFSYLANRHHRANKTKPKITTLGSVPRGFKHARVPHITSDIVSAFVTELPSTVIVLLIEHISIAKSFGRVNNYIINPSQELVAIGITNCLGPFLGAYPATGSFSRTAIKSKAGVRTPFAGVITAAVVLLAIYALPAMFWYIPNAALSAVIIHAVGDLITPPNTVYQFWRISPLEVIIFFAGVFVTVFDSIEDGIYTTVGTSAALFLFRAFKARGRFMGRAKIHSVVGDHILDRTDSNNENKKELSARKSPQEGEDSVRNIFLPIDHKDGSNPMIDLEDPYPGIFIYRFSEGFNYPNANHYLDALTESIFKKTRRTNPTAYNRPGDRPWNDPGPRRGKETSNAEELPTLKAIILDMSSVNNVDLTSIQNLIDVRNQLDKWAAPDSVDWHFSNINNRWTKRALAAAGFGYYSPEPDNSGIHRWKPIFSVAELGGPYSAAAEAEARHNKRLQRTASQHAADIEAADGVKVMEEGDGSSEDGSLNKQLEYSKAYGGARENKKSQRRAVVQGLNRPLFHVDVTAALDSALANAQRKSH